MKVLILYTAALGYGHKRSAQAIEKSLRLLYKDIEVTTLNALYESTTNLERILKYVRLSLLKTIPAVLRLLYKYENSILKVLMPLEILVYSYYKRKFSIILKKYNPDIIVCTHAFPCTAISKLKINVPLVYVVTDFDLMSYHLRTNADIILVPNKEIEERMSHLNKKIFITGVPIDPEFSVKKDKHVLRRKYKISDKTTILILGGGAGLGYYEKIINAIKNDFEIMISVGNNKNLKENLEKRFPGINVFEYTENIDEVYRIADIVVTKPGGLTSSELLAIRHPLIITNPLPGIEEKNTAYLISKDVAINVKSPAYLKQIIYSLIKDNKRLMLMKSNASVLANPESALKAAKIIMKSIK